MVLWTWGRVINLTDHRKFQFSVPLYSSRPNKHQSHDKWPNQRFNSGGDETTQSFNPSTARTEGGPYWLLLPADQLSRQHHKVCVCACVCVCPNLKPFYLIVLSALITHPTTLWLHAGTWTAATFLTRSKGSAAPPPAPPLLMKTNSRRPMATKVFMIIIYNCFGCLGR